MYNRASIYIHIPFCVKKCVYCDFYSKTRISLIPEYVDTVQKEIEQRSVNEEKIHTLYFGGGTPSLLPVRAVHQLLESVKKNFSVSRDAEITLEVNPGTIDAVYLSDLRQIGVNRLSIGVQSFDDNKLNFLGRIHTADQALKTIENAQKAGFSNISIDLIYGVLHETRDAWMKDLKTAVRMNPSHLSCYMLTIEPGTPLHQQLKNGQIDPVDSEVLSELFRRTVLFLDGLGYEQYEISSFSNSRRTRSRHNSNYWNMTPYYGFGAAAHSFDGKTRSWNVRNIETYITEMKSGTRSVRGREKLTMEQSMLEMIMLRLRTREGLDLNQFANLFGISFQTRFETLLKQIHSDALGEVKKGRFSLTLDGKIRLNSIVEGFAQTIFA